MKKYFDLSVDILEHIIDKNVPFYAAVKNHLNNENKLTAIDKNNIVSLVGCVLRHYNIFSYLINKKYNDITLRDTYLISLAFANTLFVKKFDENELKKVILERIHLSDLANFLESYVDVTKLIPEDISRHSNLYYSLRYNVPIWVVNMIKKQYGPVNLIKFLRENNKQKTKTYRLMKEINSSDYEKVDDYFVKYIGENKVKNTEEYQNKQIIALDRYYHQLVSDTDYDPLRGVAMFMGGENDLIKELAACSSYLKFDLLVEGKTILFNTRKIVDALNLKDVHVYECPHTSIITCLSSKVHTFFVIPINTNFNKLMNEPDYFLRLKQDDLDGFILNQYETLLNAKDFVEVGGELVYFVPTLSKKETKQIVQRFLDENNDFVLTKERQTFNFEDISFTGYYAILKRVKE